MNYAKLAFNDAIKALQEKFGSRKNYERMEQFRSTHGLTANEMDFVAQRDSFYISSLGENGFPYIQHRGGPKGFLKVLDNRRLAFLDFSGNMQYITLGNLQHSSKVSLFLMDYANKVRLKIYAKAQVLELGEQVDLEQVLVLPGYKHRAERIMMFHIEAFDWNCSQHITQRYTADEIQVAFTSQSEYLTKLESEVKALKEALNGKQ